MAKKLQPRRVRTDPFEVIAQEAILAAERVECSPPAFRRGLDTIVDMLRERRDLVVDELRGRDDREEDIDD